MAKGSYCRIPGNVEKLPICWRTRCWGPRDWFYRFPVSGFSGTLCVFSLADRCCTPCLVVLHRGYKLLEPPDKVPPVVGRGPATAGCRRCHASGYAYSGVCSAICAKHLFPGKWSPYIQPLRPGVPKNNVVSIPKSCSSA